LEGRSILPEIAGVEKGHRHPGARIAGVSSHIHVLSRQLYIHV